MAVTDRLNVHPSTLPGRAALHDPVAQALLLLRIGFTVAPILFGLDKFFDVLVRWEMYLAPQVPDALNMSASAVMNIVGVIEIVAGLAVAVTPRFGGWLVAGWLAGIIINLLVLGDFYDVALRDFGLLLAALTLTRLATAAHHDRLHMSRLSS